MEEQRFKEAKLQLEESIDDLKEALNGSEDLSEDEELGNIHRALKKNAAQLIKLANKIVKIVEKKENRKEN